MSQHSDEPQPGVSSDSFWEPGNYKRTARRIEDGYRLCDSLASMVAERAEMEKAYAKGLRGWAKKWSDLIEKGPEYGTMEAAWKGVLNESDRLCDLHIKVKDNLYNDVIQQLKNWQKETYHKSMIQIKERKEMEDAFKKAQKPWCKLLTRVERARTEYHTACKQQRSAANQERNAAGDTSLSPDQRSATVKKMQERVSKSREDAARWREKYEAALKEIDAYNARYMEDMGQVFERCQAMEAQRLIFFKQLLFSVHKCLNVSQDPVLPQIYDEFYSTINNADHQKDLKWWSNNHGVNMAMGWPQFEPPSLREDDSVESEEMKEQESCATCCWRSTKRLPSRTKNFVEEARYAMPYLSLPRFLPERESDTTRRVTRVAPSVSSVSAGVDSGFLEYTEEFRDIAKGKSKESLPAGPITLINQRPVGEDLHSAQDVGVYTLRKNKGPTSALMKGPAMGSETSAREELPPPNNKPSSTSSKSASAVTTLTNSKEKPEKSDISAPTPAVENKKPVISSPQKTITNGTGPSRMAPGATVSASAATAISNSSSKEKDKDSNPFEEEEWDEEGTEADGAAEPLTDTGEPGVPVRALYDYQGAESDELSFRQGDLFEKLEDEDEQGWCKGRKEGRVGLYPANYVEPVGH